MAIKRKVYAPVEKLLFPERVKDAIESLIGAPDDVLGNEHNHDCPFCIKNGHKRVSHLHINYKKNCATCHQCPAGYKNLLNLLRDLGGNQKTLKPTGTAAIDAVFRMFADKVESQSNFESATELPKDFKRLYPTTRDRYARSMLRYIRHRGVSDEQIEAYSIGFCDEGRYDGQLVFPVYVNDVLVFFTTRRVFGAGKKTLNPAAGESKSYALLGYDRCFDAEPEVIYIVEGPFDLWALERAGLYGVALMGSSLTEEQAALLSKVEARLVLCLDPDAHEKARKYASFLQRRTPNEVGVCKMPGTRDLGDYGERGEKGFAKIAALLSKYKSISVRSQVADILSGRQRLFMPRK